MLEPLPDASRMRATDAWAIEVAGIPGLDLMERAGVALADATARLAAEGRVTIVCGRGNNGGDGYVAARVLRERGREVTVVAVAPVDALGGDARVNADRLPGPAPIALADGVLAGASVIVDCVLGTGVTGAPRDSARDAVAAIDAAAADGVPVVACDVPSGVDASSGEVAGEAVRADVTATFHAAKPGLWIHPGKERAGAVEVVDIGIPVEADGAVETPDTGLLTDAALHALPRRGARSTKFTSGHVVVAGGSRGLTGAPCLAALGAMRAGAGYVTACVPRALQPIVAGHLLEAMTVGLPDDEDGGSLVPAAADVLVERCRERGGALVLGPGLGRSGAALATANDVALRAPVALVLDADGLGAFAGRAAELAAREAPTILTPHAGELGRLLGVTSDEIGAARLHHVRAAAAETGAVVVLKGDDTLVARPDGIVAVSRGDAPALATAGTGDVLAGVIAALASQGLDAFTAACAGVHLHRAAGRLAAVHVGSPDAVVASDVVAALPGSRTASEGDGGPGR
jgi:hydroxyethylthiazole kinase-like uncharacterized protein yjeF